MTMLDDVLAIIDKLTPAEKETLKKMLSSPSYTDALGMEDFITNERFSNGRVCPHCGCVHVVRNGRRKNGSQRYICRDCGKSFAITTNSIASGTRKPLSVWKKYIECMIQGLPLRTTAAICDIGKNTAFRWRHKILDALQNKTDSVVLEGIVEVDETFFDISYKGNHSRNTSFEMPREARKRGHSSHTPGLSNEKVCVPCAVNRTGQSIAQITNTGSVSANDLHTIYDGKIKEGTTLVSDKHKAYPKFAKANKLTLIQLKTGKAKKGIFNIQHINNYHSQLKKFMRGFNGVSTKYLNNYLVWNNLVNYAREADAEKLNILLAFTLTTYKSEYCSELSSRPAIPVAA